MYKNLLKITFFLLIVSFLFFYYSFSTHQQKKCSITPNDDAFIPYLNKSIPVFTNDEKIIFCLNDVINLGESTNSPQITSVEIYYAGIFETKITIPEHINEKIEITKNSWKSTLGKDINILFYIDDNLMYTETFFINGPTEKFPTVTISQESIDTILNDLVPVDTLTDYQIEALYQLAQHIVYIPHHDFTSEVITKVQYIPENDEDMVIITTQSKNSSELHTYFQQSLTGPYVWIKFDASFGDYSFLWDDMIVSWMNHSFLPAVAYSTLDYWYTFQVSNGVHSGLIPRQIRPYSLTKALTEKNLLSSDVLSYSAHHAFSDQINNPFLMAEVEWELYQKTPNKQRISEILPKLIAYYNWIEQHKTLEINQSECSPLYVTSTIATGADNNTQYVAELSGLYPSYELMAQQQMLAKRIAFFAKEIESNDTYALFEKNNKILAQRIRACHYDQHEQFFFNLIVDNTSQYSKHYSSSFVWGLYSDALSKKEVISFLNKWMQEEKFGGAVVLPSLPRTDPHFSPQGDYWQGGVWPPHWWIFLKSLEKHSLAEQYHHYQNQIFNLLDTIYADKRTQFEYLSPTLDENKKPRAGYSLLGFYTAKENFFGWGSIYQSLLLQRQQK